MIDSAQKRGELIGHLEAALELADELNGGRTGFLIEQALDEARAQQFKPFRQVARFTMVSHLTHFASCKLAPPCRERARTAIAELADIPAQPCGRDCGDRSVRRSNPDLRAAVCLSCCGPWTAATAVVCGDSQSVGGVAGSTDGRSIPVEHGAHLFGARQ